LLLLGGTALVTTYQRNSPRSHLYRGQLAMERVAWDEAAAEFEQAITQDPSQADPYLYFHLGLARNYLEQPEEAIPAYEAALEIDPAHTASLWNLAMTYLDLERYAEARTALEAYRELTPAGPVEVKPYLDELESLGY
jgi:tetratricopeptide (TPR) repeat protein